MKNRDSLVARAKEKTLLETGLLHRYFCGLKYEIGEEEEKSIALFERLLHQEKDFFAPHPPLKVGG